MRTPEAGQGKLGRKKARTFSTSLKDLEALRVWLASVGVTVVAMDTTGVYWGKRTELVILVQHIERAAKRIYGVPEFRFYAIADGIKQLLFGRNTGIGPPRSDPRLNLLPLFS